MKRNHAIGMIGLALVAGAVFGVSQLAAGEQDKKRTSEEITKSLEARYGKAKTAFELTTEDGREVYAGTVENQTGTYRVQADALTGQVTHITLLSAKPRPQPASAETAPQTAEEGGSRPASPAPTSEIAKSGISLDRAREIALQQVAGTFDGIEVEQKDGMAVYEVEVVTAENREVKVAVDPLTGQVLSIMWED
ncbi:hypothetical protein BAG01nite_12380 [Brevibacillus agri]|uniref:Peptidase n=1 Tax=Brevibacillus agri TaxID=51101 RepID=A0A3M8ALV0_9BACL|nr:MULTISPECIES: PepSY domain-containing protein [Brevibacillus]ELK42741.1 peptidase propeptide and ypeb domain-containing protein [Brevibacillus agri BAB-2500]EJL41790.1 putative membrane protein [Brevibacillus sp. CF112]MDN4096008.1 PepSY domain-containing protein [Brevibacillus agri]MDR9503285.1 PepSY domain-containing protein [Brevibacillus agri]MED1645915.1 PepSY domain-containing protein [Brevibacillus agri]